MTAPKRWVDDADADEELRNVLRDAGGARRLDDVTRRRLGAKVARASAVPVAAAGWLFVKSAAAALGVVVGTASIATFTGIIDWPARPVATAPTSKPKPAAPPAARVTPVPVQPQLVEAPQEPKLNPEPALPSVAGGGAGAVASGAALLSAESLLLEQARREMRRAPAVALQIAAEHAQRFPRGQLASERTLIQIEALHRSGRDAEARTLARSLTGASGGLYGERVRQLLGEGAGP